MAIRAITEVGVAVRDLAQATKLFVEVLGATAGPVQDFAPYGMRFCLCRVGQVDFELMEPIGDAGVIAQFLARFGEGLHHIGFSVDDAAETQRELTVDGLRFVDAAPRRQRFRVRDLDAREFDQEIGFTFSRPSSLLGLVLEFIEYPAGFRDRAGVAS